MVEGNLLDEEVETDQTTQLEIVQHVKFATSMGMHWWIVAIGLMNSLNLQHQHKPLPPPAQIMLKKETRIN